MKRYHADRSIPPAISAATLADLGQQVRVHRPTYTEFGPHTQDRPTLSWSGALYWLGRLQFERHPGDDDGLFFFVFSRRGPADAASLPTDTALRRVVATPVADGESWSVVTGRMPA
ncbi:MAG: acyltransferase domain-containing protein [Actinomycetes bacterium]